MAKDNGSQGGADEEYELEVEVPEWLKDFVSDPYNLGFIGVLAVALYFRAINLGITSIWPDTANHLFLVNNLFQAHTLTEIAYQGALMFFAILKIFSVFMPIFMAGKITSILYSAVGITAVYFLGKELVGKETGIAAAAVMSFVPVFWFQSTRPLLDTPITSVIALIMLCLVKYERTRKKSWAVALGLSMVAAITTKLVGMLVFFAIGLYFLLAYRLELLERLKKKDFQILTAIVFGAGILFLLFNYSLTGSLSPRQAGDITRPGGSSAGGFSLPFHFFFFKQIPNMISWLGVLLLIPGIYISAKRFFNGEKYWLGLYMIALAWFGFFSIYGNKSPRYILPAVPLLILVAFVGVPKLFGKFKWESIVLGIAIIALIYPAGANMIERKSYSYTGYSEAGDFLRQNIGEDDVVIAGAKRQMRLFTGAPYLRNGGYVINNKKHWNRSDFVRKVQEFDRERGTVWLVVDRWEYTQPDWIYPPNRKKLQWLQKAGFELVHAVEKPVPTRQGLQNGPVVMVFRYTGSQPDGS